MKKIISLIVLLIGLTTLGMAQFEGRVYEASQIAQVTHGNSLLNSAWCGGINSIQPVEADLNQDGKLDLVQYDHSNFKIKTFINIGNTGESKYKYNPLYEKNFPILKSYLIMKDYNCDGIADLFHRGDTGVIAYKGYYDSSQLKFTFYKAVYYPAQPLPINAYVQLNDIPAIVDMDNDGDLDMLSFDVPGVYLNYYKNMRVENNLPCDSIAFTFNERCWGKFYQTWSKTAITNITCKGNGGNELHHESDANEISQKQTRHAGNSILALDIEGDGDMDILDAVFLNKDVQLLINGASTNGGNDIITAQDTTYNQLSYIVDLPNWPAPSLLDIDNDGDKDLLFTSHADNNSSANYQVCLFYQNIGTNANPNYLYKHDSLFTNDMIDVGSYSYPTFFDYDKDGKLDLFIGNEGYLNHTTGLLESKLALYKNVSIGNNISFELITKDFLNLSTSNYKGIFPSFGDVTGDGIDDLLLGGVHGKIIVYQNQASSNLVQANFTFLSDSLANVFVDQYSFPFMYDVDNDGKKDMLVGNVYGTLEYFKDTSLSATTKEFKKISSTWGNVKAGKLNQFNTYCVPFIGNMDYTNKAYLLVGSSNGTIQRYDSLNNVNFTEIDSNYSFIKTTQRSAPCVADLNNDGKYEMVIGNKLGGILLFEQLLTGPTILNQVALTENDIELYPNPTQHDLMIDFLQTGSNNSVTVTIYDITGKKLNMYSLDTKQKNVIETRSLSAGMYLINFQLEGKNIHKKFIKE